MRNTVAAAVLAPLSTQVWARENRAVYSGFVKV
jgi:hypothetical protein